MKIWMSLLALISLVSDVALQKDEGNATTFPNILGVEESSECIDFYGDDYPYRCKSSALCLFCPHKNIESMRCQICDGKKECPEGEDEEGCPTHDRPYLNSVCAADYPYSCATVGSTNVIQCLKGTQICDGLWHCSDGSDENGCDYSVYYGDKGGRCRVPDQRRLGDASVYMLNKQIVEAHNYFRCLHGSPEMAESDSTKVKATFASENSATAGQLTHTFGGENLAWITNDIKDATGFGITKLWYDEITGYNFSNPSESKGITVNFSQVVWKSSRRLGCSYTRDSNGGYHIACEYEPPGNINGQYKGNVAPP